MRKPVVTVVTLDAEVTSATNIFHIDYRRQIAKYYNFMFFLLQQSNKQAINGLLNQWW